MTEPAKRWKDAVVGGRVSWGLALRQVVRPYSKTCRAICSNGRFFRCSRKTGHSGQHVAAGESSGTVFAVWPNN